MKFINSENIPELLKSLAADGHRVWAPQVIKDTINTVLFAPWQEDCEISFDAYTTLSAKSLLLPATEKLFSFRYGSQEGSQSIEIDPGDDDANGLHAGDAIFAARVCDARAITALDALFSLPEGRAYNDPGYRLRRQSLLVITLACTSCDSACFCSSFGEGPAEKTGSDIILYPVEGGFLAEAVTPRGHTVAGGGLFSESGLEPPRLAETTRIDLRDVERKFLSVFSDEDFWRRAVGTCLSCGYCTYCCPTCHCFDIFDEMRSDREGERLRTWDACMFHLYTHEASGHNPRPQAAQRYRNRIGHKFSYYPANQGEFLCTGCGRCIRGCPAGMDIRDALLGVSEGAGGAEAPRGNIETNTSDGP